MSSYRKIDYCKACKDFVEHNWYDNTPKHHQYTAECNRCKLRTLGSEMPDSGEQTTPAKASQV